MPIVTGPLFSTTARGTVAKNLTFRETRGTSTCRQTGRTTRPPTAAQLQHRGTIAALATIWRNASTSTKATWLSLADRKDLTPYTEFIAYNYKRLAHGLAATAVYPPIPPLTDTLTVTNGTPPPAVDYTGTYVPGPQFEGNDAWYNTQTPTLMILHIAPDIFWMITDNATPLPHVLVSPTKKGIYHPFFTETPQVIVS